MFQIWSVFALLCLTEIANGTPLFQGLSVQKGFEVNLKPLVFKPITFFQEKWSPFGRFGVRKGVQKRDLGDATSISDKIIRFPRLVVPAPVFEHVEETKEEKKETPATLRPSPEPVKPVLPNIIRVPSTESKPPTGGLYTSVGRTPPATNYILERPARPVLEEMYGELPPRPVGPVPAQPVYFTPAETVTPKPAEKSESKEVIPLITPPPPSVAPKTPVSEIPPPEGPFVKGSKLALYFGNVFLQLVSQFLTNARTQFSQFRQPPPPAPAPERT